MEYISAYTRFFRHHRWTTNWGLGAVMSVIPLIGPMLMMGWCVEVLQTCHDNPEHEAPEVTFERFGDYLKQSIWLLIVGLVPVAILIPMLLLAIVGVVVAWIKLSMVWALAITLVAVVMIQFITVVIQALMLPVRMRVALAQELQPALDWKWILDFYRRVGWELVKVVLLNTAIGFAIFLPLLVTGAIGMAAVLPVLMFAHARMEAGLYRLYLERGGQPAPIKWVVVTTVIDT